MVNSAYVDGTKSMKMSLLHDILRGLEELERREAVKVQQKSTPEIGVRPSNIPKKSMIKVIREPSAATTPTTNQAYPNYAEKGQSSQESYQFDPNTIVFYGVRLDSPQHHAKLKDLEKLSRTDPGLAQKILTLA
jgi:hypothetical protein